MIDLLLQMLRHQWADFNIGERINVKQALQHPCWPKQSDQADVKKLRGDI
jgi:hypothetical protein